MSEQIVTKEIMIPADMEKLAEQGILAGQLQVEMDEQEKEFDIIKGEFKEKERAHNESCKQKQARVEEILRDLDSAKKSGKVKVTDKCLMRKNFEANTVEYLWPAEVDAGEDRTIVETRPMNEDERQSEMFAHAGAIPEGGQEMEAE